MDSAKFLRVNSPDVVSETIDGETVIINLYQGLYYNLNAFGSWLWTSIEAGRSLEEIRQIIAQHHSNLDAAAQASVDALFDRLLAEELVVAGDDSSSSGPSSETISPPSFEAPVLYKYADMQDLLALDPIHDVDETGWPNQPAEVLGASNF